MYKRQGSRGGSRGGGLALNIGYSDNDTNTNIRNTDNSDRSVRIHEDNDTTITDNSNRSVTDNSNRSVSNDNDVTNTTNIIDSYNYTGGRTVVRHDDDDDDNGNNDDLRVTCRVDDTRIEEGDIVTYEVIIRGGNSPFDIEWDGDIDGDDQRERVRYNREGRYEVRVTVEDDDGHRDSDTCDDVIVDLSLIHISEPTRRM